MGKRGRKPNTEKKGYFYNEQEEAVAKYITTDNLEEKNRIYNETLKPAFEKMVESIINRYKLYVPDEMFEDTFHDTISFLMTKIDLYKPDSGFKAYSYCGTICKNYLIWKLKNYAKNIKRNESFNNLQQDITDNIAWSYQSDSFDNHFFPELIAKTSESIKNIMEKNTKLNQNELKIGKYLVKLLDNWENMDYEIGSNKFNKSNILLFLKENTSMTTQEIRNAMKKYKLCYYDVKKNLLNEYL